MGEWELADDTGLARSAYISSESALRTELLLDDTDDTDDTLLTLRDLKQETSSQSTQQPSENPSGRLSPGLPGGLTNRET